MRIYSHRGLGVERALKLVGLSRNQYYHQLKGKKPGKLPSTTTKRKNPLSGTTTDVDNLDVVRRIIDIKLDPDHANYYKLITRTMNLEGYYINHKKVYRLMLEHVLLEDKIGTQRKNYVKYRRVIPSGSLEVLEMDIKYVYIHNQQRYAFILTVLDTYNRYVLHWAVGYSMKSVQVQDVWEYIIANYIQPIRGKDAQVQIEVRSDNGRQFSSNKIIDFFKDNELVQVFTHPYTPEENGHIESFHKTLGKAIENDMFDSLKSLEQRLVRFYKTYNNARSHGSLKGLPPAIFWALNDMGYVENVINQERRTQHFKVHVAYQDILALPNIYKHKYQYRAI